MAVLRNASVTIASGAATSGAYALGELTLIGLHVPSTFDGTSITFTACDTLAGTYLPVTDYSTGVALAIVAAASKYYAIDPIVFLGVNFVKLVANSNQATTDTIVGLVLRVV